MADLAAVAGKRTLGLALGLMALIAAIAVGYPWLARRLLGDLDPALRLAVSRGDLAKVHRLVDLGAHPDATESEQWSRKTALMLAAEKGDVELARVLLRRGADLEARGTRPYSGLTGSLRFNKEVTPLMFAATEGHTGVADVLLRAGAKVDAQDELGDTALEHAAREGHAPVVRLLLSRGAAADGTRPRGHTTPLMNAAFFGRLSVVEALLDGGADVHAETQFIGVSTHTALTMAAMEGHRDIVQALLQHRASPRYRSRNGYTPLDWALEGGHLETAELLLEGKPIPRAALGRALTGAARRGDSARVRSLLLRGADPNTADSTGETVLMVAAGQGELRTIELLLSRGAKVNATDAAGSTALLQAAWCGKPAAAATLLRHGADPRPGSKYWGPTLVILCRHAPSASPEDTRACLNAVRLMLARGAPVDQKDPFGTTPLHHAVTAGNTPVVQELLAHGADPLLPDPSGETPLAVARKQGNPTILRLLQESAMRRRRKTVRPARPGEPSGPR